MQLISSAGRAVKNHSKPVSGVLGKLRGNSNPKEGIQIHLAISLVSDPTGSKEFDFLIFLK